MFVIADMEWVTDGVGCISPTQLAAVRIDENRNETDRFAALIRPSVYTLYDRSHMAFNGAPINAFLNAKGASAVFADFVEWLSEDDVLLWWHKDSDAVFKRFAKNVPVSETLCISKHICAYLKMQHGNIYYLSAVFGMPVDEKLMHCSENDVAVIHKLLQKIEYPYEDLKKPLELVQKEAAQAKVSVEMPYWFESETGTVHRKGCKWIGESAIGFGSLKKMLRQEIRPCNCCAKEYKAALREKNASTIERAGYLYLYTPTSRVFHKRNCGTMLLAKNIIGSVKYDTAVKTGRTPCRLCNPTPENIDVKKPESVEKKGPQWKNTAAIQRALRRQEIASKERRQRLPDETLSEREKSDIMTLTHPSFAFWNSRGYSTFHLRSCPKLNELSDLRGFGTYKEALHLGLRPCRKCKPTEKHDLTVSLPTTNHVRKDESVDDLKALCAAAGFEHHTEMGYFCLETPVGKWRIDLTAIPFRLEHNNLVKTPGNDKYHEQPRIFLSLTDAFCYIKRHDDTLKRDAENGKAYVMLLS